MNKEEDNIVITIDGPVASGKSTIAGKLAQRLGFLHIDSGALYRKTGLLADTRNISLKDEDACEAVAKSFSCEFRLNSKSLTDIYINGEILGSEIRTENAGSLASVVSCLPKVRKVLTAIQREQFLKSSLVLEGRDAGTIVFPDAKFKFYLDAAVEIRALRRLEEQKRRGKDITFEQIKADLEERDHRDKNKGADSLKVTETTQVINTDQMTIDDVVDKLEDIVRLSA